MMKSIKAMLRALVVTWAGLVLATAPRADVIVGTQYGSQLHGIPFAIAMEKGYFKEASLDITGILTSKGGGTSIRNLMAGDTLYAEVALSAALSAIQEGFPIKIVSGGTDGNAGFWVTRPDMVISKPEDLKGKRFVYSRPKSVSEVVILAILKSHGVNPSQVQMVAIGDFGAGLVALDQKKVDIASIPDPLYSLKVKEGIKYQHLAWLDAKIPDMTQTVGVATDETIATRGDKLRAVIAARRKAVDFIYAHPREAESIVAKVYNIPPDVVAISIANILKRSPGWWSRGGIKLPPMDAMAEALGSVGALKMPIDWKAAIDSRFLPTDLKGK